MAESKAYVVSDDKRSEQDVRKENRRLVKDIVYYCSQRNYKKHNVLLIGQIGSGKSSIINTLLKVIIGQYIPRAKAGLGKDLEAHACTLQLKRYKNCGAKGTDFEEERRISDITTLLSAVLNKLPDIFDAAGMNYKHDKENKEILRLLIGGHIPPNTSMEELMRLQTKNGLGYLPLIYRSSKNEYKISMVVFACSCTSPTPYNLIKCVQEVLQEVDQYTSFNKYDTDVFVLITKYDKVLGDVSADSFDDCSKETTNTNTTGTPNDPEGDNEVNESTITITLDQFKKVHRQITEAFIQKGTATHSQMFWKSYNDFIGYDNVYVDNNALKLLKVLTTPLHTDEAPSLNNFTYPFIKLLVDHYFGLCRALGQTIKLSSVLIIFLPIIVLVFSLLGFCFFYVKRN